MEYLIYGIISVICIYIITFIGSIFQRMSLKKVDNGDEKSKYLMNQYKHLFEKIDENKNRKIINIEVSRPSFFSPQWRVFKYIESRNPMDTVGDRVLIFTITDEELSNKIP